MGETGGSGCNPGFDEKSKKRQIISDPRMIHPLFLSLHLSYLNSLKLGLDALDFSSATPLRKLVDSDNNRSAFVNRFLEPVRTFLYLAMDKTGLYRLSRPSQILNFLQEISRASLKGSRQRFKIEASG